MATIPTGLAISTPVPGDRTTPGGFRRALGALFGQSAIGTVTPGILPGPGTPLTVTTSASAMTYTVSAGFAVTSRTGQGAYIVGTTSNIVLTAPAANATNPRIDIIYIFQPDPELADAGVARIDILSGSPAGSPVAPTLSAGMLELGRKLVPAGAANTSTGTAITNRPAYVGLAASWSLISGKPTTFPPDVHTHTAAQITDPLNINAGEINGSKLLVQQAQPSTPAVGDAWISW